MSESESVSKRKLPTPNSTLLLATIGLDWIGHCFSACCTGLTYFKDTCMPVADVSGQRHLHSTDFMTCWFLRPGLSVFSRASTCPPQPRPLELTSSLTSLHSWTVERWADDRALHTDPLMIAMRIHVKSP